MVTPRGATPAALLDCARGAALLVVGSMGHGGFRGLVLGSVSLRCVLHATCPVTAVHATRDVVKASRRLPRHDTCN